MLAKRLIACLDVKENRVVKGVRFQNLRDSGDPFSLAQVYESQGADEIVFLDISASLENRRTMRRCVRRSAENCHTPICVGGGIRSAQDALRLLESGADKIAVNTAAVHDPDLISKCAESMGSQSVVLAIDAYRTNRSWNVAVLGGSQRLNLDALKWAKEAESRGAGEILLTSIDRDGTRLGYDLELVQAVSGSTTIPVIASGGCGTVLHMIQAIEKGADGVLVAGLLHDRSLTINQIKRALDENGIAVRRTSEGEF